MHEELTAFYLNPMIFFYNKEQKTIEINQNEI